MATGRTKISAVWRHFTKINKSTALCNLCRKDLKFCGNTTNLKNHLKLKHKMREFIDQTKQKHTDKAETSDLSSDEDEDECNVTRKSKVELDTKENYNFGLRQQTVSEAFNRPMSFEAGGEKFESITSSVMYMVTKDGLPLNTVEKRGFRRLMQTICPLYKVPGETKFTSLLHDKEQKMRQLMRKKLQAQPHICLTTDIWTEMMHMKSYLGVTGHFVHENKIESCMLGVVLFDDSKTGENIADTLKHICDQWEITENKVLMVVTDQGANIMKGVKLLFGSKRHIPCFGHIINLVASKSVPIYKQPYTARLEPVIDEEEDDSEYIDPDSDSQFYEVISVIKKLKLIIKFFKSSETASRMLREQQMTEGRKEGHRLVLMLDVRTRWNSILSMVERFILLTNHVSTVLLSLPKSPPMLSGQELGILKELIKAYSSMALETPEIIVVKTRIVKSIEFQFRHVEDVELMAVSTLLDPRFKNIHFESAAASAQAVKVAGKLLSAQIGETTKNVEDSIRLDNPPDAEDLWSIHDNLVAKSSKTFVVETAGGVPIELKQYLNAPVAPRTTNPLELWDKMKSLYPNLHKIALQFLPMLATSVPSERLFSKAGQLLTKTRNKLSGSNVDMLLFLQSLSEETWFSDKCNTAE
ncbi:zinc finger BED domain-containing protein 4 isoform X2 [Aedes aegypti]|uniref:Uncharacterized protein n=1 Tax=Aedes aegypti TaxID=7159 RepID=A0A6I8TRY5_AEDAE|nr:zinc finger BED domain-containing protein 4 isoform X2 [Aedes aegypti]